MSEDKEFLDDQEMDLFSDFLTQKRDKAQFELVAGEEGFDPEKIQALFDEIRLFISARIMRKWDDDAKPPRKVTVQISLDIA